MPTYGNALNVEVGPAFVFFGTAGSETALGYTSGDVTFELTAETQERYVDQETAPIGEDVTKMNAVVVVPLAERDFERLAQLIPGASVVGTTTKKLVISGASGIDLTSLAKSLVVKGDLDDKNTWITLHKAVPLPEISISYGKSNTRVYRIRFKGMVDATNGLVTFGDVDAA